MQKIEIGNEVVWTWGRSEAKGKVTRKFPSDVELRVRGKTIRRRAHADEPAFLSARRTVTAFSRVGPS
jgi:hypothetical protein